MTTEAEISAAETEMCPGDDHDIVPIGGDVYSCTRCPWTIDMLEDADGYY